MICENPNCFHTTPDKLHHVFFKSQYFGKDRDEEWNKAGVCHECHRIIHHASPGETAEARKLDIFLKQKAIDKYEGEHKDELQKILTRRIKK